MSEKTNQKRRQATKQLAVWVVLILILVISGSLALLLNIQAPSSMQATLLVLTDTRQSLDLTATEWSTVVRFEASETNVSCPTYGVSCPQYHAQLFDNEATAFGREAARIERNFTETAEALRTNEVATENSND